MSDEDLNNMPVVKVLALCMNNPREGLSLISRMNSESKSLTILCSPNSGLMRARDRSIRRSRVPLWTGSANDFAKLAIQTR